MIMFSKNLSRPQCLDIVLNLQLVIYVLIFKTVKLISARVIYKINDNVSERIQHNIWHHFSSSVSNSELYKLKASGYTLTEDKETHGEEIVKLLKIKA